MSQQQLPQMQKPKLYLKIGIHALSFYNISIQNDTVEIEFVMENYRDVNLTRVKNIQTVILNKNSKDKFYSYRPKNDQEVFLRTTTNPIDEQEFTQIRNTLVNDVMFILNMNIKISMLRRQKRKYFDKLDKIQRKEFNSHIRSLEKSVSSHRKNIKSVLNGLF